HKAKSLLFLIGDPKQAIYSFRGADIFTYMDAAASRPLSHYTLGVNHRSTPELVQAVNTLFNRGRSPFVFEDISFQPVSSAEKAEPQYLTINGQREEPFILWHLGSGIIKREDSGSGAGSFPKLTKTAARRKIILGVASEVARLLILAAQNKACLNGKSLLPGDIAILVRTNNEARKMQQVLAKSRIPSVLHSGEDLFASGEARETALLLGAIVEPHNIRKMKTALLTRLIGVQRNDIALGEPAADKVIEQWLSRFKSYHKIWKRSGFIRMFWTIMAENRIRSRMLALENGERILTNFLHLAEILHQEEDDQGLNMTRLLGFLHERLTGEPVKVMEHQLRLESDADRVKIVTIHKAKGLEYPVVFCPFTWEGSRLQSAKGCIFHRRKSTGNRTELLFDAGSPEMAAHLQTAVREEMAENLRLLYVAVTRAIHRCYLVWGPIKGVETSGPAYLLHQEHGVTSDSESSNTKYDIDDTLIQKTADRFMNLSGSEFLEDLHELAAASENTIRIASEIGMPDGCYLQTAGEPLQLKQRIFQGDIEVDWQISSFSHMTSQKFPGGKIPLTVREDAPGQDDLPVLPLPGEEPEDRKQEKNKYDIFSFPRGPGAGTMLHQLLELVDFRPVNKQTVDKLISDKLLSCGYDIVWQPVIAEMLANLSGVILHDKIPGLTLANIPPENSLRELEFYFPVKMITPEKLKAVFSGSLQTASVDAVSFIEQQLDRLTFSPARGFMKGYIDLVFEYQGRFYLLDWKSNYLGSHIENYHKDRLLRAINSGFYFLQYHLYTLALHLYLKSRLSGYRYETHFGGIFYIFLRGVQEKLGPDFGIFYDRPNVSMMENFAESIVVETSRMLSQASIP
ncbi:MAG: UvrD-helicase domain-containing protein, partial [Deltaproteobacteria bacterium]|nr:UvrD-helicase domain-containing protein [Deltaproteobacteria bacterium]